jgi:hypothetical protein
MFPLPRNPSPGGTIQENNTITPTFYQSETILKERRNNETEKNFVNPDDVADCSIFALSSM